MDRSDQEGLRCSGIGAEARSARLVRRRLSANWTWRGPHRSRATRVASFTRMRTFEQSACHCGARADVRPRQQSARLVVDIVARSDGNMPPSCDVEKKRAALRPRAFQLYRRVMGRRARWWDWAVPNPDRKQRSRDI